MISIYLLLDLEFHQYVTMSVIWKMHMIWWTTIIYTVWKKPQTSYHGESSRSYL